MDAPVAYSELRFSTDVLPASERLPWLRELLGHSIARCDLSPVDGHPFRSAARMYLFDGLAVLSGEASYMMARRSRALLSDGNHDLVFHVNRSGFTVVSQAGRECRIDAGQAALIGAGDPATHHFPGRASWLTLRIPRRRLLGLVGRPEDAAVRLVPASAEPLRLLLDYVDVTLPRHRLASPQLRQLFATHVYDLVALAIGATRDTADAARGRGLKAARLNAAKGAVMRRLENEGLTIGDVATSLGVTPRYVQRLFESDGTTFSEYVAGQRLACAYRTLSDPRFADRTVTSIAFDVGFDNLSYFNRLFRRHYGATPSDVREAARRAAR
jgi:AraC-like DNA-binding protein